MMLKAGGWMAALAVAVLPSGLRAEKPQEALRAATPGWQATGTLLEACSCSVPCPCNFGQGPSRGYCHSVYAYRLKTAHYGATTLDGLIFGGGEGDKGGFGFLDARATPTQRAALEKLARAVFAKGGPVPGARRFMTTHIVAEDDARRFHLDFQGSGGFTANLLLGGDGVHPIVVENNTTWPVHRFLKGKTTAFDYTDALGNRLRFDGVNANLGEFTLSGSASP